LDRYTFVKIGEAARKIHSQPTLRFVFFWNLKKRGSFYIELLRVCHQGDAQKIVYSSISLAARALAVRQSSISTYLS